MSSKPARASLRVGPNLELLNSFTGATRNNTGYSEPPDTQIAVSPTRVVETVNLTAFVFDHGGNELGSFDLAALLSLYKPNNYGADPKIVYDAGSKRWFISLMVCQNAGCGGNWTTMGVNLAVSSGPDPAGNWTVYQNLYGVAPFNAQGNLQDQPKLGFSDDKVTMTANVYLGHNGSGAYFTGEDVIVLQKSNLIAGKTVSYGGWTSGYAFDSIPAVPTPYAANNNTTQYVVWQGYGLLHIDQITGTPDGGNLDNSNVQSPAIGTMTASVDASGIPSGAAGDNNIESVTWESNHLWASATDGCTPAGDFAVRDCIRVDEIDTSNPAALTVLLDQDLGDFGVYYTYPSVTQDCVGDLHIGATYSDTSGTLPSASDIGTSTPGTGYVRYAYFSGDTAYTGTRWGAYSGIAEDPSDCGNVWTAQEYGGSGSGSNWATGIGQFSFDAPSLTSMSPSSGPATGGTTVDLRGLDFVKGGTSVSFGGTASPLVSFVDAHHIRAVSPAGSGGPVNITVTTSNGTAPTLAANQFSWVPTVTGVSPASGPVGGGNSVSIKGAGFAGATSVRLGSLAAASFTVNSDDNITAKAPAHPVGVVDVRVTTPGGRSGIAAADKYTYEARPAISAVTPDSGPVAGGSTVTLTGSGFVSGASVKFGTTASAAVAFVSSTKLKAQAPVHTHGSVQVTMITPGGASAPGAGDLYAYGAPSVSSFAPSSGITGSLVSVTGTGFAQGEVVKFGALVSPSVTVLTGTSLKALVPNGAAPGHLSVSNSQGSGTSAGMFHPTLSITSFTPGSASHGGTVTIVGVGFTSSSTVKFHGVAATAVTHVSSTKLKAVVPGTATSGPITVTNTSAPIGTVQSRSALVVA